MVTRWRLGVHRLPRIFAAQLDEAGRHARAVELVLRADELLPARVELGHTGPGLDRHPRPGLPGTLDGGGPAGEVAEAHGHGA